VSTAAFSLSSETSDKANRFERGTATALRLLVLLLAAYIVFHKAFPLAALDRRLADMTVGEFLLTVSRVLFAFTAAGYLIIKGFRYPGLQDRDRIWCERWSGIAFGVSAVVMAAVLVALLEQKGINLGAAHWIAHGILLLLF
jgi:hypothetical protein